MRFYLNRRSSRKSQRRKSPRREEDGRQEFEEKAIWIRGLSRRYLWFKLSLSKNPKVARSEPLSPALPEMPEGVRYHATSVISGSTFYTLGGLCSVRSCPPPGRKYLHRHREVYYLDHQQNPHAWETAPPMLCPRCSPACVDLDGKIYVFGGILEEDETPFAEVFDPNANAWKPLTPPPNAEDCHRHLNSITVTAAAFTDSQNRPIILLHLLGCRALLAYRVYDDSWTCLNSNFAYMPHFFNVVDNVLYCLLYSRDDQGLGRPDTLAAYDLRRNQWLSVNFNVEVPKQDPVLVHLGGDRLCLLNQILTGWDYVALFFRSFSVEKVIENGTLCSITTTGVTYQEYFMESWEVVSFNSTSTV